MKLTANKSGTVPGRTLVLGVCLVLAGLVWLAFGGTLGCGFVDYDDDGTVYNSAEVVRGLSGKGVAWAFSHTVIGHWDPLTTLSHMADCQLYGLHPWGHHLTNVLLHAAAAVLLFLALWDMTGALWRSALTAALFAVHPLRVESVAWVTERKDVLSGVFFMLTLLAYTGYARGGRRPWRYLLVALLFGCGMMSKSMLVTLPFVLLLLDWWPLGRWAPDGRGFPRVTRSLVAEKIPLIVLSGLFAVIMSRADAPDFVPLEKLPFAQRAEYGVVSYVDYLRQTLWPAGLAVPYPDPTRNSIPHWQALAALAVLAGISYAAYIWREKRPWLLAGWLWYLGMLAPVFGIALVGGRAHADRYTYLPQIGLALMASWAAAEISASWSHRRLLASFAAGGVLAASVVATRAQTAYWHDSKTLWNRDLACIGPSSAAYINLGNDLLENGRPEEAIAYFLKALAIKPNSVEAYTDIGSALSREGRLDEAISEYQKALEVLPANAALHCDLGVMLALGGRVDEAISQYQRALEIRPDDAEAHYNFGLALVRLGRIDEAVSHWEKAVEAQPGYYRAENCLGIAQLRRGQVGAAISHWEKALEIVPDFREVQGRLAWVLAACPDPAYRDGTKALDLARRADLLAGGRDPSILKTLAAAYAETGRFPEALEAAGRGAQLARAQSNAALEQELRSDIALYKSGAPVRDASLAPPGARGTK